MSNTYLGLHDHKVRFLSRTSQSVRQFSILNTFEVHTWEYVADERIEPLRVCKGQFGQRVHTQSLND